MAVVCEVIGGWSFDAGGQGRRPAAGRLACAVTLKFPVSWKVKGGGMQIGEVAGRSGVPVKTIRFWEDQRLLLAPARTASGYRDYDPAILERLAFIRHAQAAGLSLDAIGHVLDIRDGGQPPSVPAAWLIARRKAAGRARLAQP